MYKYFLLLSFFTTQFLLSQDSTSSQCLKILAQIHTASTGTPMLTREQVFIDDPSVFKIGNTHALENGDMIDDFYNFAIERMRSKKQILFISYNNQLKPIIKKLITYSKLHALDPELISFGTLNDLMLELQLLPTRVSREQYLAQYGLIIAEHSDYTMTLRKRLKLKKKFLRSYNDATKPLFHLRIPAGESIHVDDVLWESDGVSYDSIFNRLSIINFTPSEDTKTVSLPSEFIVQSSNLEKIVNFFLARGEMPINDKTAVFNGKKLVGKSIQSKIIEIKDHGELQQLIEFAQNKMSEDIDHALNLSIFIAIIEYLQEANLEGQIFYRINNHLDVARQVVKNEHGVDDQLFKKFTSLKRVYSKELVQKEFEFFVKLANALGSQKNFSSIKQRLQLN